jgi:anti-sigma B factor antagonist
MPDVLSQDSIARRAEASGPDFVCSWSDGGLDAAWVHLGGELDVATVPQLEYTLGDAQLQARLLVLDLRELAFIDGAGVRAIVNASIRARQLGRRLVLLRGNPNVNRMFALTGSSDDLEVGDVDVGDPGVGVLLRLAEEGPAS